MNFFKRLGWMLQTAFQRLCSLFGRKNEEPKKETDKDDGQPPDAIYPMW